MLIDPTHFPIVRMHFDRPDPEGQDGFAFFETLLDREQPFVLISNQSGEHEHEEEPGERKRTTLWMKAHRVRLQLLVRGMVFIIPTVAKRLAFKATAIMFSKFWGYPILIAASEQEALTLAERLLAGHPVASPDDSAGNGKRTT